MTNGSRSKVKGSKKEVAWNPKGEINCVVLLLQAKDRKQASEGLDVGNKKLPDAEAPGSTFIEFNSSCSISL